MYASNVYPVFNQIDSNKLGDIAGSIPGAVYRNLTPIHVVTLYRNGISLTFKQCDAVCVARVYGKCRRDVDCICTVCGNGVVKRADTLDYNVQTWRGSITT